MRLDQATWPEVEAYLGRTPGIVIPSGSTEQHGPMGLIGTDALCAEKIADGIGTRTGALVAPTLAYTPAPFNTAFPGTVSISEPLFEAMASEIVQGLVTQGFRLIYFLNGHGANLAPLSRVAADMNTDTNAGAVVIQIRNWWDFEPVDALRTAYFGDWEGMHATPSEVAITQAIHRVVPPGAAKTPPKKLSADYVRAHAGDRHGPPDAHRRQFPDGRVGSHSALASPEYGTALLESAVAAASDDYQTLLDGITMKAG